MSTCGDDLGSIKATARQAGVLYLLLALTAPFNEIYVPRAFIVPNDPAATADAILAGELTYRIGIFSGLCARVIFLYLGLALYQLFRDVDRAQARLLVSLVFVAVAIGLASLVHQTVPLILLRGSEYASAFAPPQLDALAMGFLRLHRAGVPIAMAFWGLWLFPFGWLVIKSGFFPKWLGILLLVGGVTYVALSFTAIVFPGYRSVVSQFAVPFYAAGELAMIFWLLVVGPKPSQKLPIRQAQDAPSHPVSPE